MIFTAEHISHVFTFVTVEAGAAGLWSDKIVNLATAVRQLATDGLTWRGTTGTIRDMGRRPSLHRRDPHPCAHRRSARRPTPTPP